MRGSDGELVVSAKEQGISRDVQRLQAVLLGQLADSESSEFDAWHLTLDRRQLEQACKALGFLECPSFDPAEGPW